MMRATSAILLTGLLLVGTLLVPYDYATRNAQPKNFAAQPFSPPPRLDVPAGKILVAFPDLWEDQTTLTLFEGKVYIPQTIGVSPGVAEIFLPSGSKVLPGSRWLNTSVDAPAQPNDAQFDFEFVSADDRRGVRGLHNHGSYDMRLEESMNDWSPDSFTRWRFLVYNNGMDAIQAHVKITIARDAGPLPAHVFVVDRWQNQDTRVVYDHKDVLRQNTLWRASVPLPEERGPAKDVPLRGVPALELQELRVHLYYNSSTSADVHYRPLLSWNSPRGDYYSNDRANMPPTQESRGATGHFLWRIPVQPEMYDNVLGSRSRWQISVNWHGNSTDVQEYHMEGDFHFTILAHRNVEPGPEASRS
jgi:hypothetical protein